MHVRCTGKPCAYHMSGKYCSMEKKLSERSHHHVRLRLVKCLAEKDECTRKRHAREASQMTKSDHRGVNESVICVGRSDGNVESCPEQAGVSCEHPGTIDDDSRQDVESDGDPAACLVLKKVMMTVILLTVTL